jgi:Tfp pilus assembly protein PilV
MTLSALGTSPAHPLYLYVVFAVCVIAAIALLIGATISRRNSSWRRQMQLQATTTRRPAAYPIEPAKTAPVAEDAETNESELVGVTAAKKPAPRKTTTTATKKTTAAKKTAAKKTSAKKT